ncbi:MAG: Fic family protein [Spirochaetales bacterium]|nr:Fic family protein [Candidatus Physcosoma equi]
MSFAKEAGLPYTTVSELVNEKKQLGKCSADTVYAISKTLHVSMEELLLSDRSEDFPDRFHLNEKASLFLAKHNWDENVYCGMKMENRAVTFSQTKTILEGVNVPSVKLEDILAIRNMRDAWKYMFGTIGNRLDLDYIMHLNSLIARDEALEWGVLRTGSVGISGTDYRPEVPVRENVEMELHRILSSYRTVTEKALDLFCFITYRQLFWDGNKRTALAASNHLLLSHGCGLMTIKDANLEEFNRCLLSLYSTGKKEELKSLLYQKAIFGIEVQ